MTAPVPASLQRLLLAGCGTAVDSPSCEYKSENLLQDPRFETLALPRSRRNWQYSQHAGEPSFAFSASDGTLRAEQVGTQPWGLLAQSVPAKPLRNRRVEFSAELKLDLTEPAQVHGFKQGAGLTLTAKQASRLQLSSMLEHEPHAGQHDWHLARVVVQLPRQMSFLRAGILHQAGGTLEVRNPSLRVVTDDCATTPRDDA